MRVSELSGALLDYWVARCELTGALRGHELRRKVGGVCLIVDLADDTVVGYICEGVRGRYRARKDWNLVHGEWCYQPSEDWTYGGPIIDRDHIGVLPVGVDWSAWASGEMDRTATGPTALVAAMRAKVVSCFGHNVTEGSSA
ncbi:hypothetical protein BLA17378_05302 [Burkholderia aenigmatica]|uniref:DUF2591 domain-containing protein n=1 Tax=Burkholderia aenigmatica TaxID=2015348 RepID=A0ABY6Y2D7_9BURK|nr:phage protein NinX family protein [Burkholderia aenigmatica]VWD01986.1 hypothetical protein BLA17378_05302 [Burkholderia aenigmatica]